tara:strand:+ start:91 stop:219 length:129 start_codon:yes stop_codon:yes gene_type:complete
MRPDIAAKVVVRMPEVAEGWVAVGGQAVVLGAGWAGLGAICA